MTQNPQVVRFGIFEVDLQAGELRKSGVKLKLTGQPFQVLTILLERPGEVVTREELQQRLWPDTFVDVDHNLNTAINKIREALGDAADTPRFVETLPRRGYRFIAPADGSTTAGTPAEMVADKPNHGPHARATALRFLPLIASLILLVVVGAFLQGRRHPAAQLPQRALTRITFDDGLQIGATWSPDGRFIAYSSDRRGKSQIWVQQVSGGDPVQITKGPDHCLQPEWSPDGKFIAYRYEAGNGGIFIIPALGGVGLERKISSFGYYPHWSPDSSQLLFQSARFGIGNKLYVVRLDGTPPREVLAEVTSRHNIMSAAWHPDGRKITAWAWEFAPSPTPRFWTALVDGGQVIQTQISSKLSKIADVAAGRGTSAWADSDFKFAWAPSGTTIYFERTFHGARNIWRMSVEPETLQATTLERLTTGAGLDSELALSPDATKLAFTAKSQRVQAWMFPFDAQRGKITGDGQPITSPGMEAWESNISHDGRYLVSSANRDGKWELWEKSLPDGPENPVIADDSHFRDESQWSPDGTRLAYVRSNSSADEFQLMTWSRKDRVEEPVNAPSRALEFVFSWSPDGEWLLTSQVNAETGHAEVWMVPVTRDATKAGPRKVVTAQLNSDLWQAHLSPDGRWIVFEANESHAEGYESAIYVTPVSGGPWIRITDGKPWDDKPRWSPDGRTIYYLSEMKGYFNVWGRRFDPEQGRPQGEPFAVTSFDNPKMMVGHSIPNVGFSLTQDRLVLTITQVSGSIWVLDNVDR